MSNALYSPLKFKYSSTMKNSILFLHVFSAWDSASGIFKQRKINFRKTSRQTRLVTACSNIFNNQHNSLYEGGTEGQKFISTIYNVQHGEIRSLNKLRYDIFAKIFHRNYFNLPSLLSTEDVAKHHAFRIPNW